jgi:alkylation response protein AidB-like acyl-CoA dehydrogenase
MTVTTTERAEIRELARSIARDRVAPYAAEVDESARFPNESYRALVEAQLHAVVIPEEYGGVGADALTGVVVAEEIARVCASTQQVSGANELFAWPLLLGGSPEQRRRWLSPIAAGRALGAFALSEPEAGSDVAFAVDPCRAAAAGVATARHQTLDHQRWSRRLLPAVRRH